MARHEPRLRLADRFTHVMEWDEAVVLVGESDHRVLKGEPLVSVVPLLDGRFSAIEIARVLADRHRPEMVHFVLMGLEKEGLVHGASTPDPGAEVHAPSDVGRLAEELHCLWATRGDHLYVRGRAAGFGKSGPLSLLLTEDYLDPGLLGALGEPEHAPVLLVRMGRTQVWVGPWVGMDENGAALACLSCLQERLATNLVARGLLRSTSAENDVRSVRRLGRSMPAGAFLEAARIVGTAVSDPSLPGSNDLVSIAIPEGTVDRHPVRRLPQCPACGDPTLCPPGADLALVPRRMRSWSGGGYRALDPEETLRKWSAAIDPFTGPVRSVSKVPVDGDDLVHVYTASHASVYRPSSLRSVRGDLRDPSGGKGATDLDAKVSALCESLERFSAMHRGSEPTLRARWSELGAGALRPNQLQLFSEAQFAERDEWNAGNTGGFQLVTEPYGDEPIEWSKVRSLVSGDVLLVPSAAVYLGFSGEGSRFCRGDSNGLAGGNCVEEAILQGFMELVERDAVALWWYNRARRPSVRLERCADPFLDKVSQLYPSLGRRVWALDLTTDLEIPCFAALSSLEGGGPEDIIFGFGAHFDARIALRRAFTELNQMLPTVLRSEEERRRQLLPDFADAVEWWNTATLSDHPYLLPATHLPPREISFQSPPTTGNLREDVTLCATYAEAAGLDMLVHNLTRPDVGFPVVKVIVPGLRHFWRRLAPGRLYDTPVELEWLPEPVPEFELNPVSIFV